MHSSYHHFKVVAGQDVGLRKKSHPPQHSKKGERSNLYLFVQIEQKDERSGFHFLTHEELTAWNESKIERGEQLNE